ncbi:hypothetical protein C1646_686001 [Rhizophagus diaphanus]|nr:hypothetical protein C1646_686001 [Rhizophagus diaphanus] [Rhizophagus sp. MUCL 43196]
MLCSTLYKYLFYCKNKVIPFSNFSVRRLKKLIQDDLENNHIQLIHSNLYKFLSSHKERQNLQNQYQCLNYIIEKSITKLLEIMIKVVKFAMIIL